MPTSHIIYMTITAYPKQYSFLLIWTYQTNEQKFQTRWAKHPETEQKHPCIIFFSFYSFPRWIKFPKLLLSTFLPNQKKMCKFWYKKILIILPRPFKSAYVTMRACMLSLFIHLPLFATPGTIAHQALLSMEVSRQGYWTGLPCPPPGNLPNPGIELASLTSSASADRFFTTKTPWESLL